MTTTLLITTYNSPTYLRQCLLSLQKQTVMPDEVVIADDGSTETTRDLIDSFRNVISVPIIHIWHEDNGFRLCTIRNKAIVGATGDYIIQIDGDIYMDKHFIEDHISIARTGYWVNGSRVWLSEETSSRLLANDKQFKRRELPMSSILNSLRCSMLRQYLKERYAIKKVDHVRGCNLAYWRKDAILVNGYDEDLTSWGHEDGEFVYRLHFAGIKKQSLKMGGVAYHIYHKPASRDNETAHHAALDITKSEKKTRCVNGLDKYLVMIKNKNVGK